VTSRPTSVSVVPSAVARLGAFSSLSQHARAAVVAALSALVLSVTSTALAQTVDYFPVPAGSHPHDVAPAAEGNGVWFTAQASGHLGLLDPESGEVEMIPLGRGSRPHGVIVGPDGAAWVTDGGLNAIVRDRKSTRL